MAELEAAPESPPRLSELSCFAQKFTARKTLSSLAPRGSGSGVDLEALYHLLCTLPCTTRMLSTPSGRPGFGSIAIMAKIRSGSNSRAEGDDHFPGIDVLSGGNRLVFWVMIMGLSADSDLKRRERP